MVTSRFNLLSVLALGLFISFGSFVAFSAVQALQGEWIEIRPNDAGTPPNHDFILQARTAATLTFPVPTFRPFKANSPLALDLHPAGPTPVESPGNGYTWFDACDNQLISQPLTPISCARLAMRSVGAVVSAVSYNGDPAFNLYFETATALQWGINTSGILYPVRDAQTQIGSGSQRVTDIFLSGWGGAYPNPYAAHSHSLTATIIALEARIAALEALHP